MAPGKDETPSANSSAPGQATSETHTMLPASTPTSSTNPTPKSNRKATNTSPATMNGVVTTRPASTKASDMPQTDPKRHVFPFFDLPRELRDLAYDEMLVSLVGMKLQCHLKVDAENVVDPELMTINRQFTHEYRQRGQKKPTFTFHDQAHFVPEYFVGKVIPRAMSATELRVNLRSYMDDVSFHFNWLESMLGKMPRLESLSIKLVQEHILHIQQTVQSIRDFAKLSKLVVFEVFAHDNAHDMFELDEQKKLVLRWSAETGSWEKFMPEGLDHDFARLLKSF